MPFRVAVCLSGHMRSYRKTSETLFACLLRPGVHDDILTEFYVHTWKDLGPGMGKWDSSTEALDVGHVMETYRPTFLCVEEHNPESWAARSMFRKIQLAYEAVISSGKQYDMVVRARPDTYFTDRVPLSEMLEKNAVYLPSRADFGGLCDQFAVGDVDAMGVYSRLWSSVPKDDHFHPETRLKDHLSRNGVTHHRCESIKFKIMRSDGSLYDTMSLG